MATSSIKKTFTLRTREETNAFMKLFEELLRDSPELEKSGIQMATENDVDKMIKAWKTTASK